MSNSVILPSMTEQIVLESFKHLVECELRKHIPSHGEEFWYGTQEGWVACLVEMFGEADDATADLAYRSGGTWLQITTDIVNGDLNDWATQLAGLQIGDEVDFKAMQDAVSRAVNEYALQNPTKLSDALKKVL